MPGEDVGNAWKAEVAIGIRDDRCHERGAAQNRGLLRSRRAAGI